MSAITHHTTPSNLLLDMAGQAVRGWIAAVKTAREAAARRREERDLVRMIETYEHTMPSFAADLRAALARRS